MIGEPRLELMRKLTCSTCGYWEIHNGDPVGDVYCCGRPMVETYADQGLLTMDEAATEVRRKIDELADALGLYRLAGWLSRKVERVTRRWRRTDA